MPRLSTPRRLKLCYAAVAAADTWLAGSKHPGRRLARWLTKPLLMPLLSASLATDRSVSDSPLRTSTLLAQAAGWGGDLALLSHRTSMFAAGTGSFALGHLAYLTGFCRNRRPGTRLSDATRSTTVRVAAIGWLTGGPTLALGARRTEPRLAPAVLGYSAVLTAMAAAATGLDRRLPADARALTALGGGLFLLSDSVLGVRKFWFRAPSPALESVVMATYTTAQLLLSEGAARAQAH